MEALITDIRPFKVVEYITISAEVDGENIKAECLITRYNNNDDIVIRVHYTESFTPEIKRVLNALLHRKYSPKYFKLFPYDIENFCSKCFSPSYILTKSKEGAYLKCKNCNNIKLIKTYEL
jgi:hypothetical protein